MFMTSKYALKDVMKRSYRSASTMSKAEIMFIMILFPWLGIPLFKAVSDRKSSKRIHLFSRYLL